MFEETPSEPLAVHRIGGRTFDFSRRIAVMAVVNRTPDSFYDHGATFALQSAVDRALQAADTGADWVDIGGVPFGRGPAVTTAEEIDRVVPTVRAIASARPELVVSVDTNRADVAEAAIEAGAAVINDTSGLGDPRMAEVLAASDAHVVITHSVGPPRAEKPAAHFDDVVAEVSAFLRARMARAEEAGIPRERLIIDPGHDLDKNTLHSLELTRRLAEIVAIGPPVLVAVSNKDFIGESIDRVQGERLTGSIAAMVACVLQGARIVRMHDVAATVDAVRMVEAILGMRAPARLEHNTHPTHNV
ncbi:MAG: dihydropteroate synthase [Actinobacteria bacterium]|nr:dihydropteroate synthase [Actinomycetota bacterium]